MRFTNILVYIGRDDRAAQKMQSTINLARDFDASVTALYVVAPPLPRYFEGYVPEEAVGKAVAAELSRAMPLEGEFRARSDNAGVEGNWVLKGGRDLDAIAELYRYTDLIVMGQSAPEDPDHKAQQSLSEDVVMSAGGPVLMLPHTVPAEMIGKRVMIAWNRTREATRAVTDSLSIIKRADEIVVYSINPPGMDHIPGSYVCDHLKRHGIDAEPEHIVAHDIDVADVLLSAAHDHNTDLIVMGAYGHSRFASIFWVVLREISFSR